MYGLLLQKVILLHFSILPFRIRLQFLRGASMMSDRRQSVALLLLLLLSTVPGNAIALPPRKLCAHNCHDLYIIAPTPPEKPHRGQRGRLTDIPRRRMRADFKARAFCSYHRPTTRICARRFASRTRFCDQRRRISLRIASVNTREKCLRVSLDVRIHAYTIRHEGTYKYICAYVYMHAYMHMYILLMHVHTKVS